MALNRKKIGLIVFNVIHTLVGATFIFFTCHDLHFEDFSASWLGWVNFFVLCVGLVLVSAVTLLIVVIACRRPTSLLLYRSWFFWAIMAIIPLLVSACLQEKWILGGFILVYLTINVCYVVPILPDDDDQEDGTTTPNSINGENEPLIYGTGDR